MYVIAHLSDPHLDGSEEARARLRKITSYVRASAVDVVLVTGDLADHGLETEYAEVAGELSLDVPVLMLPGNHDVSSPLRAGLKSFVDSPGDGHPVHQVRDVGAARFVLVDSTVPGQNHGLLSDESLAWLDGVLLEPFDGPVFVAMHHPPLDLHHPVMDQWMLQDRDAVAAVLTGKPITAILTGHVHNAIVTSFGGHPVRGAPGIRSTVPVPFEPSAGTGSVVDPSAHPGLAFHIHTPGEPLQTIYRYPAMTAGEQSPIPDHAEQLRADNAPDAADQVREPDRMPLQLHPVARVESSLRDLADAPRQGDEGAPDAWVVFDESVRAALADVRPGDELILISWFDRADRSVLKVHPRSDPGRPPTGVFSTRSPDRPNPLGLHRVTVQAVDDLRLQVNNLEALDGTPIVDVKPVIGDISDR